MTSLPPLLRCFSPQLEADPSRFTEANPCSILPRLDSVQKSMPVANGILEIYKENFVYE